MSFSPTAPVADDEPDLPLAEQAVQRRLGNRSHVAQDEVGRLLEAARGLMTADPSRAPKVAELVSAAGVTNQAFYRSFASRDDLLAAVVDDGSRRLVAYVARRMDQQDEPRNRLRAFLEALLRQAGDPVVATTTRAVLAGSVRRGDRSARSGIWLGERLAELLRPELELLGSADPERDARAAAYACLGSMEQLLWREQTPQDEDLEHLHRLLLSIAAAHPART